MKILTVLFTLQKSHSNNAVHQPLCITPKMVKKKTHHFIQVVMKAIGLSKKGLADFNSRVASEYGLTVVLLQLLQQQMGSLSSTSCSIFQDQKNLSQSQRLLLRNQLRSQNQKQLRNQLRSQQWKKSLRRKKLVKQNQQRQQQKKQRMKLLLNQFQFKNQQNSQKQIQMTVLDNLGL